MQKIAALKRLMSLKANAFWKKVKLFVMTYSVCLMALRPNTFSNVYILVAIYFDNFIENIDNAVNYVLSITNKLTAIFMLKVLPYNTRDAHCTNFGMHTTLMN